MREVGALPACCMVSTLAAFPVNLHDTYLSACTCVHMPGQSAGCHRHRLYAHVRIAWGTDTLAHLGRPATACRSSQRMGGFLRTAEHKRAAPDARARAPAGVVTGAGRQAGAAINFCTYWGVGLTLAATLAFRARMGVPGLWLGVLAGSATQARGARPPGGSAGACTRSPARLGRAPRAQPDALPSAWACLYWVVKL